MPIAPNPILRCGRYAFDLTTPRVMGILNVTPNSFSDGGRYFSPELAVAHGLTLMADGADIIDVGGESTRPGASPTSGGEELARVIPVVERLVHAGVPVSVDTRKPEVMRAAIDAGASMINDVSALGAPGALELVAGSGVGVCLMHMRGEPATMQQLPSYDDVVREVTEFLGARAQQCVAAGIARERIALDPGYGFGKTLAHNIALVRGLPALTALGFAVLVGVSRKSSLGQVTGRAVEERLAASLAAGLAAVARGASFLRVHDVRETVDALKIWTAFAPAA